MKEFTYNFTFSPVPDVMKRGRHALIVVKNDQGKYLLGAKDIYPKGIYRFVGGGIDKGEDPILGAAREIEEELLVKVQPTELKVLAKFTAYITSNPKNYVFETFVFFLDLGKRTPTASDDIQSLVSLTKEEVRDLAERYKALPTDLATIAKSESRDSTFRWSDYGAFYGEVHKLAMELVD